MSLLEVSGLSLSFGGVRALSEVDFAAREGTVNTLIGPNGAGKTTLFNCITGFLKPESGSKVRYRQRDVTGWSAHRLAGAGLVRTFQHPKAFADNSLRENIQAVLAVARQPLSRADELLRELGLLDYAEHAFASAPYGVTRRLNIALALALNPALLMLDEPGAGLSEAETRILSDIIDRLRREGRTIVLVEHNMKFVMNISDQITVLNAGRVIASGRPQDIARNETVVSVYLGERAHVAA